MVLALTACSAADRSAARVPAQTPTSPSGQPTPKSCPKPAAASFQWPPGIPSNFPKPPGARIQSTRNEANGLQIVRLTTPFALREGILFVLKELPKAGFNLGRGDAEAAEADAPFQIGNVRGVVRLVATVKSCETVWLVAAVKGGANGGASGGAPFMPFTRPSASPSLPFG